MVDIDTVFSDELLAMMGELTAKQRLAIPRLVQAQADGTTMRSLLQGPDRICAWSTYYRPERGWSHQEAFKRVVARAREEYDQARLRTAVEDAAERMRRAAPVAVELAEEVVLATLRGVRSQDEGGAAGRLLALMGQAEKESDQIRAASTLLGQGLKAALSILDRADIETAVKSAGGDEAAWRDLLEELRDTGDGDAVADVEAEGSDL